MADIDTTKLLHLLKDLFSGDGENLRELMEILVNALLQAEMTEHLQAEPYERTSERKTHRNGYKDRELKCRLGTLELRVPQARDGSFSTKMFERYQRSERALELTLVECYLKGVSTRKVGDVAERLFGRSISAQTVSNLCKQLDGEIAAWRARQFEEDIPYLVVDARYEKVRRNGRIVNTAVLIATGVTLDGHRRVLDFRVDTKESTRSWSDLFESLKKRGLSGVELVVSDRHSGLVEAARRAFPGMSWQRCQCHFSRNVSDLVPKRMKEEVAADLRDVYNAPDGETARARAEALVEKYEAVGRERVAQKLDEELEDALTVFAFSEGHWRRLRTTNGLERLNQEIKRRTTVVRIFPNDASLSRLVGTLLIEQDEKWMTGRRYLNMAPLLERRHDRTDFDEQKHQQAA